MIARGATVRTAIGAGLFTARRNLALDTRIDGRLNPLGPSDSSNDRDSRIARWHYPDRRVVPTQAGQAAH